MELSIRVADPAGNITIFVMSAVAPEDYAAVAAKLLAISDFRAEQVAFHVPPQMGADGRIQMMGGEFCGNATRSYGYLLSTLLPGMPDCVRVEISGADKPLTVRIDRENARCETDMPLPVATTSVAFEGRQYHAVCFDGIMHMIVPGAAQDRRFVDGLLAAARSAVESSAYGIMFLDGDHMVPVVYVCETDSLIWEGSCGSGSTAVGVWRAMAQQNGVYHGALQQPGGVIEVTVSAENGRITQCRMGGPVSLTEEITVTL